MKLFEGKALSSLTFDEVKNEVESRDLTEGWFVDWKVDFPKAFGKYVASFANTHGGYLFVGVEEDPATKKAKAFPGVPAQSDPQEKARNIIRDTVDPFPYFEKAAIEVPDSGRVILIIYVPESTFPPHIYKNGRIYLRQLDASEPVELKERYTLDRLYDKQMQNAEALRTRIQQTIFFRHVFAKLGPWDARCASIRTTAILYPVHLFAIHQPDFLHDGEWKEFLLRNCYPHGGNWRFTSNGFPENSLPIMPLEIWNR